MSKLPFELLLALRYLRPKRTFVSIITLISIIGVMLGVAVLIIVISVMSGFDHDLKEKVLGFNAHLRIVPPGKTMENYAAITDTVMSNRNVKGVAPFVLGQVMLKTRPAFGQAHVAAPYVRGLNPEAEAHVSTLLSNLVAGTFDLSRHGLVVGDVFAANMALRVGDRVEVRSPEDLRKMEESLRKMQDSPDKNGAIYTLSTDYEIRGIFSTGYDEFDSKFIITSLEDAQGLYDLEDSDSVHGLLVAVQDPFRADGVARELQRTLGPELRVTTWMEDSPLMMAVLVEKNVMLYVLFFIVIVAAFGTTCTLITFIMMKTRELGMMKAVGATNWQVMCVFLAQSLIVSALGVLAGVTFGLLAIAYRNEFLGVMRRFTGVQLFPADIYGFSQLPALVLPGDIAVICGGSMLICLLAAVFPAWYASKLNPVEALRHE